MSAHRKFRRSIVASAASAILAPLALALLAAAFSTPAFAISTVWFGGAGDWGVGGNWSFGQPGAGDTAVINAGTATLGFDTTISGLTQAGGIVSGAGVLTLTSTSTWSGGSMTGTGTSQFNGNVTLGGNGSRSLSGARVMNTAAVTTWSGNTAAGGNAINFVGSATISNSGTWNDANSFDSSLGNGTLGTKAFNNAGSYNKTGNSVTDIYTAFNNNGTVGVNAGQLNIIGSVDSTSTGTFNIAAGSTLSFGKGGTSSGVATLNNVTFGGTGTLLINASGVIGSDVVLLGTSSHAGLLTIATGTLEVDGSFGVATYNQTGGQAAGTGALTVGGLATLSGGEQTGTGTSQFNGNVTLGGNGSRSLSGARVMNTAAVTTWSGNTAAGGNAINFVGSATISNSGTWNDANSFDSSLGNGTIGTKAFNNAGSYNKTGNSVTDIYTAFNNNGTVGVNAGQLNIIGSVDSTSTGTFNIAAGSTLSFGKGGTSSGVATLNNVTFGGTGTLLINASGVIGSDVVLLGTSSHAGLLTIATGTLEVDGSFGVATYNQTGGQAAGTGALTVGGLATLSGGEQTGTGTSQFNGNVTLGGNGSRSLSGARVMNTAAVTTWSGNTAAGGNAINFVGSATISNSGTWNDANSFDSSLGSGTLGTKAFNNAGTYNKTGSSVTDINAAFNNTGTVGVSAGRLSINGSVNSTSTGTFNIAAGSTLSFGKGGTSSGVATLNNVTFGGTGTLLINASGVIGSDVVLLGTSSHAGLLTIATGTLEVDGSFGVATYNQAGGQAAGTGALTVGGLATLSGGEQTGTGTSQFNGNVTLGGNGSRSLSGARVMNTAAVTTWSGNTAAGGNAINFVGSATINNSGTWNDANSFDSSLGNGTLGTKVFNNAGTYNKIGNSVTNVVAPFHNTGTVNIESGATFRSSCSGANCFVNSGTIKGHGTLITPTSGLTQLGNLSPGSSVGHLTIDGDLTDGPTAVLNIELASLSSYDLLTVTGNATLGGDIAVQDAGYIPVLGNTFTVMTFNDATGTRFDSLSVHGFGPGVGFDVIYNPHDVTLKVVSVPEPGTWPMLLVGLGWIGIAVRRRGA